MSTIDHTLASAIGSFETAGHRERSYWPLRDHKTSKLIDLTLTTQPTRQLNEHPASPRSMRLPVTYACRPMLTLLLHEIVTNSAQEWYEEEIPVLNS